MPIISSSKKANTRSISDTYTGLHVASPTEARIRLCSEPPSKHHKSTSFLHIKLSTRLATEPLSESITEPTTVPLIRHLTAPSEPPTVLPIRCTTPTPIDEYTHVRTDIRTPETASKSTSGSISLTPTTSRESAVDEHRRSTSSEERYPLHIGVHQVTGDRMCIVLGDLATSSSVGGWGKGVKEEGEGGVGRSEGRGDRAHRCKRYHQHRRRSDHAPCDVDHVIEMTRDSRSITCPPAKVNSVDSGVDLTVNSQELLSSLEECDPRSTLNRDMFVVSTSSRSHARASMCQG